MARESTRMVAVVSADTSELTASLRVAVTEIDRFAEETQAAGQVMSEFRAAAVTAGTGIERQLAHLTTEVRRTNDAVAELGTSAPFQEIAESSTRDALTFAAAAAKVVIAAGGAAAGIALALGSIDTLQGVVSSSVDIGASVAARFVPGGAGALVFARIAGWARDGADAIVEANNQAVRAGLSFAEMRTQLRAFEQGGLNGADAVAVFNTQLESARDASTEAAAAFRALGLQGQALSVAPRTEALRATVEAIRNLPDAATRQDRIRTLEAERDRLRGTADETGRNEDAARDVQRRIDRMRELIDVTDAAAAATVLFGAEAARLIQRGGAGLDRAAIFQSYITPSREVIDTARRAQAQWEESGEFIRGVFDEIQAAGAHVAGALAGLFARPFSSLAATVSDDISTVTVGVTRALDTARTEVAAFYVWLTDERLRNRGVQGYVDARNAANLPDDVPTIGTRQNTRAEGEAWEAIVALQESATSRRQAYEAVQARLRADEAENRAFDDLLNGRATLADDFAAIAAGPADRDGTRRIEQQITAERAEAVRLGYLSADASFREFDALRQVLTRRRELVQAMEEEGTAASVRNDLIAQLDAENLEAIAQRRRDEAAKAQQEARQDLTRIVERARAEDGLIARAQELGLVRLGATRAEAEAVRDLIDAYDKAAAAQSEWAGVSGDWGEESATAVPDADLAAIQQQADRRRRLSEEQSVREAEIGLRFRQLVDLEGLSVARANERLAVERGISEETARRIRNIQEEEEALGRARSIRDSLRSPIDTFREAQTQIQDAARRGLLNAQEEQLAIARQFLLLERGAGERFSADVIDPRTIEGARAEAQRQLRAQAGNEDPQERVRRVLDAQLEVERRNNRELQEIARALRNAPPLRPANLPNN